MTWLRIGVVTFVLAAALLLWHAWSHLPQLPARVAVHFDASGRPDGWSDRESFVRTTWIMNSLLILLFVGMATALTRLPVRLFNLPHREFWLAPAHADTTRVTIAGWLLVFGSGLLLFLLFLQHQMVRVNLGQSERTEHLWPALAVFLVASLAWTIVLSLRFSRAPESTPDA
jgi:uncharacterized membrane protein